MSFQARTSTGTGGNGDSLAGHSRLSWRNSYWIIALLTVLIGIFSIAGSIALDWAIHDIVRPVYASDIVEAVIAAVASGLILLRMQSRRRELVRRMQIIEDINHHVRNALTAITFSSSLREDSELNANVRDACDRIDWVLNDALSRTAGGKRLAEGRSGWPSGRRFIEEAERREEAQRRR